MCSLRDAADPFEELGVTVYGVSTDDVKTQAAFARAQRLSFALLSDPDASAARKYGVASPRRPFARRVTFVIDPRGALRHVERKVDVRRHGEQLAAVIRELQAKDAAARERGKGPGREESERRKK